ncbi:polysaccharide deacetylase family protein [Bacillus sp. AGMB 02131]|uniref:Polysaccharide deacetylase family protein n=1 Tax=Peribacillus faecalis TaxID=2772559 RepID=A0A927CUB3_9BACI|nr:polysaccharide deacetylase family protein [Peribacillus faecalis]MBD3107713.1 polysaccharide deacetylase family protein [Peribacillus faecalis]
MNRLLIIIPFLIMAWFPNQVSAQQKVPILIYHSIDEFKGHGVKDLYVSPENFEKQMMYLRDHGYTLLTFEKWHDLSKVKKPIFITLDDGYKNNLNVYTVFRKIESESFKPTATMFVISDFIGRKNRLSEEDLKMLSNSNLISIQSHSATHPELTKTKDLTAELKNSKERIESITEKPVIALAYPYGLYNNKVIEEMKKYYQFGLTTIPELYTAKGGKNENYLLPRLYIKYDTTLDEFARIIGEK